MQIYDLLLIDWLIDWLINRSIDLYWWWADDAKIIYTCFSHFSIAKTIRRFFCVVYWRSLGFVMDTLRRSFQRRMRNGRRRMTDRLIGAPVVIALSVGVHWRRRRRIGRPAWRRPPYGRKAVLCHRAEHATVAKFHCKLSVRCFDDRPASLRQLKVICDNSRK